tara:strand:+ start:72 stop:494 length:423 start_codon:yes stop_codon:yes gene_type:complete
MKTPETDPDSFARRIALAMSANKRHAPSVHTDVCRAAGVRVGRLKQVLSTKTRHRVTDAEAQKFLEAVGLKRLEETFVHIVVTDGEHKFWKACGNDIFSSHGIDLSDEAGGVADLITYEEIIERAKAEWPYTDLPFTHTY